MKRVTSKSTIVLIVTLFCVSVAVTASSQEKQVRLDNLAARGVIVANMDPLAVELREQQPAGSVRRGFDIGMGAAEGHTFPGPGKDRIRESLSPEEQQGFTAAVNFSLARNRQKLTDLAPRGAQLAAEDPLATELRNQQPDSAAKLGFDIGMAAAEGD